MATERLLNLLNVYERMFHNITKRCYEANILSKLQPLALERIIHILMYKTAVYMLVNGAITHQKPQI